MTRQTFAVLTALLIALRLRGQTACQTTVSETTPRSP